MHHALRLWSAPHAVIETPTSLEHSPVMLTHAPLTHSAPSDLPNPQAARATAAPASRDRQVWRWSVQMHRTRRPPPPSSTLSARVAGRGRASSSMRERMCALCPCGLGNEWECGLARRGAGHGTGSLLLARCTCCMRPSLAQVALQPTRVQQRRPAAPTAAAQLPAPATPAVPPTAVLHVPAALMRGRGGRGVRGGRTGRGT